jgi:CRISPR-associated protein Cmr4
VKTTMLGFLAETAIHCGAGRSSGIIDLPVAREAATDYPFIPGSSVKGALLDRARALEREPQEREDLFGKQSQAGKLLVSDARLLLLPVRSLAGAYRWVTCPLVLERYQRDLARCGLPLEGDAKLPNPRPGEVLAALASGDARVLYLEERELAVTDRCPPAWLESMKQLMRHAQTRDRLESQVAVVGNDEFAWFCRYSVPVQARNVLKPETKTSENLWYEESLPPDTVLYSMIMARDDGSRSALLAMFPDTDPYLQLGGNETVGHGWVAVSARPGGRAP